MIKRDIENEVLQLAKSYPVLTILGPRQSGKTTLAKTLFKNKPYINLEAPDKRAFAEEDPRAFFSQYQDGAVLDEIQRAPSLLSYIQEIVDEKNQSRVPVDSGRRHAILHRAPGTNSNRQPN